MDIFFKNTSATDSIWILWMAYRQPPASRLRSAASDSINAAAEPAVIRPDRNAVILQNCHHPVDRIAFSDAARIDFHTRPAKAHRLLFLVQHDVPISDTRHSALEFPRDAESARNS